MPVLGWMQLYNIPEVKAYSNKFNSEVKDEATEKHSEACWYNGAYVHMLHMVHMRGSTQREALATQREKNIPHVKLINNFFFFKG